jgi:N-acyl-D-aspartate/D-glutamate deacylase
VAVASGRISDVGVVTGGGREEIDATGLAVAPGFIDPHTHYDAQLTWDPFASCSAWHGVTTVVIGNCGFAIAPCRPRDRETIMRMLMYVEGMSPLFTGDAAPLRVGSVGGPAGARFVGLPMTEVAGAMGKDVVDAFFDLALADDLRTEFTTAVVNTDAASVAEIFTHPKVLLGLSDAGAHLTLFCEAGQTSRLLGHWVRERKALSLEEAVRRITSMPADLFGIRDRGRLSPGLSADIVVFDPDRIAAHHPERVHDLPDGGPRLVQRATGIVWSFVNGRGVIRAGRFPASAEGPPPGRVLRPAP